MIANKDIGVEKISNRLAVIFDKQDKRAANKWTDDDNLFLKNYLSKGLVDKTMENIKETVGNVKEKASKVTNKLKSFVWREKEGKAHEMERVLDPGTNKKYQTMADLADLYYSDIKDRSLYE